MIWFELVSKPIMVAAMANSMQPFHDFLINVPKACSWMHARIVECFRSSVSYSFPVDHGPGSPSLGLATTNKGFWP